LAAAFQRGPPIGGESVRRKVSFVSHPLAGGHRSAPADSRPLLCRGPEAVGGDQQRSSTGRRVASLNRATRAGAQARAQAARSRKPGCATWRPRAGPLQPRHSWTASDRSAGPAVWIARREAGSCYPGPAYRHPSDTEQHAERAVQSLSAAGPTTGGAAGCTRAASACLPPSALPSACQHRRTTCATASRDGSKAR
jgi:hypothetical protein